MDWWEHLLEMTIQVTISDVTSLSKCKLSKCLVEQKNNNF